MFVFRVRIPAKKTIVVSTKRSAKDLRRLFRQEEVALSLLEAVEEIQEVDRFRVRLVLRRPLTWVDRIGLEDVGIQIKGESNGCT